MFPTTWVVRYHPIAEKESVSGCSLRRSKGFSRRFKRILREDTRSQLKYIYEHVPTSELPPGSLIGKLNYDKASKTVTIQIDQSCNVWDMDIEEIIDDSGEKTARALSQKVYEVCRADSYLREALESGTGTEKDLAMKNSILPRLMRVRNEILQNKDLDPSNVIIVSKKNHLMQCGVYGDASMRVLPDGSTFIVLPGTRDHEGGIKKVKYGVLISPDGSEVSVQMICKLQKLKRMRYMNQFMTSLEDLSKLGDHPNILFPTAMISHPKKECEIIVPKCEKDLFVTLDEWQKRYESITASKDISWSVGIDSVIEVKNTFRYLREIIHAMQHFYNNEYIHGDVKPENLMFELLDEGTLRIKLIDFELMMPRDNPKRIVGSGTNDYLPLAKDLIPNGLFTEFYALGRTIQYLPRTADECRGNSLLTIFATLNQLEAARGNGLLASKIGAIEIGLNSLSEALIADDIDDYKDLLSRLDAIESSFEADIGACSILLDFQSSSDASSFDDEL